MMRSGFERLLHGGELERQRPDLDPLVEQVDLEGAHSDNRDEWDGVAVHPPGDREHPRHELLGDEGDGDDVVDAFVERGHLGLEVAAGGERDRGKTPVRDALPDQDEATGTKVEIDEKEVRPPGLHL